MTTHKLTILFLIFSFIVGCSPAVVTPNVQAHPTKVTAVATTAPTSLVMVAPSVTLEPDFPERCISLAETPLGTGMLNGLFVVYDFDNDSVYFLDPKSNQLVDIEKQIQLSWDTRTTNVSTTMVSPNKKFIQAYLDNNNSAVIRTVDKVINRYSIQGQEDWNRERWVDNEHTIFQHWFAPRGSYTIVIFNPFTGEQKNMQIDLPNPYIIEDSGGLTWVEADIAPSLKRVLYNDKDKRLVLWDLDGQKEITSLSSPTNLIEGAWSPDGKEFAIPAPSRTSDISATNELFTMNMDGAVKKLTGFNQKYPFANVDIWPSWSPDSSHIAYWLKISNIEHPRPNNLRQWLAITDTTTLDTQIYCLSPNEPPVSGGGGSIVWSPDGTQVIINITDTNEKVKPVLVDLSHLTQANLDTHGLRVINWMAP